MRNYFIKFLLLFVSAFLFVCAIHMQTLMQNFNYLYNDNLLVLVNGNFEQSPIKSSLINDFFSDNFSGKKAEKITENSSKLLDSSITNEVNKTVFEPILKKPVKTLEELKERQRSLLNERWPFPKPMHPDDEIHRSWNDLLFKNRTISHKRKMMIYAQQLDAHLNSQKTSPLLTVLKPKEVLSADELNSFNIFKERLTKKQQFDKYVALYKAEIPIQEKWIEKKIALENNNKFVWDLSGYFVLFFIFFVTLMSIIKYFSHIIFFSKIWNLRADEIISSFKYYNKNKKRSKSYNKLVDSCINEIEIFIYLDLTKCDNVDDWSRLLNKLDSFIVFCRADKEIMTDINKGNFIVYEQLLAFIDYSWYINVYIKFCKKWRIPMIKFFRKK